MHYQHLWRKPFLLALSFLLLSAAEGQELTSKGTSITISSGNTVTVTGTVRSTAGSSLTNNGTLQTSGDFTHDGTLVYSGTGTLELNGSGAQALTATTLYNLLVSGSGVKTPSGAFTVSHNLTLTSGTLLTTSAAPVTLGSNGTLSETATAYIDGWIQTTRTLAQATANAFGGLGLTLTANGAAPGPTTVVRGTGATAVQSGSSHLGIQRVYLVTPTTNSGLNADVVFAYRDGELNSLSESTLILFGSSDGGTTWSWLGQVSRDATNNTLTMSGINSFGRLTLGSSSAPLPLTWLSFSGQAERTGNELQWATASEQNTRYFAVERSASGNDFQSIGRVEAAGNSTADRHYRYLDSLTTGTYFYRLRQVDQDGRFSYSATIRLARNGRADAGSATAFPNPFADHLVLHLPTAFSSNTKLSCTLLDAGGKAVAQGEVRFAAGQTEGTLTGLNGLPRGTYFLQVAAGGARYLLKLVH